MTSPKIFQVKSRSFYILVAGLLTTVVFDVSCSKDYTYCPSCGSPSTTNTHVTRTIPLADDEWIDQGNGKFQSNLRQQILKTDSSFNTISQVKFLVGGIRGTLAPGKQRALLGGQLVWTGEVLIFYSNTDQLPFSSMSLDVTVY
jgi:hypothetical protein